MCAHGGCSSSLAGRARVRGRGMRVVQACCFMGTRRAVAALRKAVAWCFVGSMAVTVAMLLIFLPHGHTW